MKGRGAKSPTASTLPSKPAEGRGSGLPNFDNPPVSEVACGISFEPLKPFTLGHVGLYWNRIREAFPDCEHAAPLAPHGDTAWAEASIGGLPLPRIWFISADKQGLIQLQGDCFYFNWRRIEDGNVYPRYGSVMGKFTEHLRGFLRFLQETGIAGPVVTGCELTYVNHIPEEHGWKDADLSTVFKDLYWRPESHAFLPRPRNISWKMQFPLPPGGSLTASVAFATRVRDQMPTLKFEMNAKTRMKEKSLDDAWGWFNVAHEWIVRGFVDLTQEEMQRTAWKRIND